LIVADASWVIALRDPGDAHHETARALNVLKIDETMLLHPVTLAECLVAAAHLGELEPAAEALRRAFDIPVDDPNAPLRWASLRASSGLRLPDAIVLDTALHHGAEAIATFDDRVAVSAGDRGIGVLA